MKQEIIIFTGPTLSIRTAQPLLKATYLPPVKFGDVYRVCQLYRPKIIGIIDGYFNQVPAVWHKEILWAIDQGATVIGAASMGALRAAELHQYGMIGCGKIFHAYQCTLLPPFVDEPFEDDDEVAVIHGPAELGYQALSEAMVNIRMTLAQAHRHNVIDRSTMLALAKIAKSLFYPHRRYDRLMALALDQKIDADLLKTLDAWIVANRVEQKHLDAVAMLHEIKNLADDSTTPKQPATFQFQHSSQWQAAIDEIDRLHDQPEPVINEIRLGGDRYFELLDQAMMATLGQNNDHERPELSQFHQSPDKLDRLLAQDWQRHKQRALADMLSIDQLQQLLLNHLDRVNELDDYRARAKDKADRLASSDKPFTIDDLNELELLQLADWYFTHRLAASLPDNIEDYAFALGFSAVESFYAMILDEYNYLQIIKTDETGTPT